MVVARGRELESSVLQNLIDIISIDDITWRAYAQIIVGSLTNSGYDDELITTLKQYLLDNMNMSQAAKSLYMHRNTLLYRLSRIQRLTGLNPRRFDHALKLGIALAFWEEGRAANKTFFEHKNNVG